MHEWMGKHLGQRVEVYRVSDGFERYLGMVGTVVGFTRQPEAEGGAKYGIDVEFSDDSGYVYCVMFYNKHLKKAAK